MPRVPTSPISEYSSCNGHPARIVDRRLAAGQRHIRKMSRSVKPDVVRKKDFTTPNASVRAIPGPIVHHANRFFSQFVFRHARGRVRVVVLHLNKRNSRLFGDRAQYGAGMLVKDKGAGALCPECA
jgi:hypothetical protein